MTNFYATDYDWPCSHPIDAENMDGIGDGKLIVKSSSNESETGFLFLELS